MAREGGRIGAVLFETPAARVTLSVAAPCGEGAAPTVVVPGRIGVTRYIRAGGGRLDRWRAPPLTASGRADAGPAHRQPSFGLGDGRVVVHDGRCDGHRIVGAERDVVMLGISLSAGMLPAMREYDAVDGRLLRSAATDDAASRAAMLRRFLRASGRADAADVFRSATGDAAAHVRWGAMREWLALDTQGAAPRLAAMADVDIDEEVRAVASATLAMVRDRMVREGTEPCRA